MDSILLIMFCCIALFFLLNILFRLLVDLGKSLGSLLSVFADLAVGLVLLFVLYTVIPFHPSNAVLNWGLYILGTIFLTKFLSELYLVGYSMNFVGLTLIAMLVLMFVKDQTARNLVLLIALAAPKLFWVLARNEVGTYWVETDHSYFTNTSYGYYENVDIDFHEKWFDMDHGMWMPVQIVIALALYFLANFVLLEYCLHGEAALSVFRIGTCLSAVGLAVVNVVVDVLFLKSYDEAMD